MKYIKMIATGAVLLLLTACGSQTAENEKEASQASKQETKAHSEAEHKAKTDEQQQSKDSNPKQQKEVAQADNAKKGMAADQNKEKAAAKSQTAQAPNFDQLTERERVALLFFADNIGDKSVTAEEIVNGQYQFEGYQKETRNLDQVIIKPTFDMRNQPEGMKFYTLTTPKSNFATIVGVSDTKGMVGGTQSALLDYKELAETSVEFDLAPIYEKQKDSDAYQTVMKKLKFEPDDYSNQGEQSTYMTRYRSQVYDKINEFEGHPVDTEKYDWDPTLQLSKTGWTITFRDKQTGDVAGYYTVRDGNVVKLDPRGQQIKPAQ